MSAVMNANIAVVIINAVILTGLLWAYIGMWRQAATRFTMGLTLFAAALWLQQVIQLYFYATMMQYFVPGVQPLVLVQNALVTLAAGVLLSVTLAPAGASRDVAES